LNAVATLDVPKILEGAEVEIRARVIESLQRSIADGISWSVRSRTEEYVSGYFKEHIEPAIQERLVEAKEAIIQGALEACVAASAAAGEKLREAMLKKVAEAFSSSYKAERVMKELLLP
jgi:hypothetical protein